LGDLLQQREPLTQSLLELGHIALGAFGGHGE
jgi:hypothetical protein